MTPTETIAKLMVANLGIEALKWRFEALHRLDTHIAACPDCEGTKFWQDDTEISYEPYSEHAETNRQVCDQAETCLLEFLYAEALEEAVAHGGMASIRNLLQDA